MQTPVSASNSTTLPLWAMGRGPWHLRLEPCMAIAMATARIEITTFTLQLAQGAEEISFRLHPRLMPISDPPPAQLSCGIAINAALDFDLANRAEFVC